MLNKNTIQKIYNTVNYYATNDPDIGFSDSLLPLNGIKIITLNIEIVTKKRKTSNNKKHKPQKLGYVNYQ